MRKPTPVLFVFPALLLSAFTANSSMEKMKLSDSKALHLKGRIQSVSELLFNAGVKADRIFIANKNPLKADTTRFDKNGNKVDEKIYNAAGQVAKQWSYKYDNNENLLEYVYTENGRQVSKDIYTYSAGKMATSVSYTSPQTLCSKAAFIYDARGLLKEQDVEENFPVKQNLKKYYNYDTRGNRVGERMFILGRSINVVHTWKYNAAGNITEEDNYSAQGTVVSKTIFTYNPYHRLTEQRTLMPDGSVSSREAYKYNARGRQTEDDIYNMEGKLYHYYTYSYDAHGNITHKKEYKIFKDAGLELEKDDTYELAYDKKGNWVKKTDLKLDGSVTLTERAIHYY